MVNILECGTPADKDRWLGHLSILPRVFGPSKYLVTPPVQLAKPRLTSKPMPPASTASKLVQPEAQSDTADQR